MILIIRNLSFNIVQSVNGAALSAAFTTLSVVEAALSAAQLSVVSGTLSVPPSFA